MRERETERETHQFVERERDGGLGAGGDSGGAVRIAESGAPFPVAGSWAGCGVRQHADKLAIHCGPHDHIFWAHHYFPHCYWRPHLHRLIQSFLFSPNYVVCFVF